MCDGSRTLKGLDDGFGIGGVGVADGVGVDVPVSEWSLQADPGRSRNASAMLLSSFFTIECYDSMRQRNQIYLERWTGGWTACKFQAGYAFNTPSNGWICLSEKERSRRRVCNYLPTVVNEPPQRSSIHRRERPYSILTGLFPHKDISLRSESSLSPG